PDEVGVLYSIDPTETLRCTRAAVRRAEEAADHQVSFSRTGTMPSVVPTRPRLSIASQPVVFGRSMRLLTHERHYLRGRRLYLVRAAELSMDPPHAARVSGVRLFHSARSLLGTRIKHNVNLWSCTYASGLDFDGEVATIAYGINDTDFSIASLEWSRLW
ncbi:MAG: hypothetical protein OSA99_18565, partial [Acidimicrobiales bacterium]|nr:hypothetical protein [Acidimicrobiales bacterium]